MPPIHPSRTSKRSRIPRRPFPTSWADLPAAERERLFDETAQMRDFERALDPDGISTTARAVLARII